MNSKTAQFFPALTVPLAFATQAFQFGLFARANGIDATPAVGTRDHQDVEGYVPLYVLHYTKSTGEWYDVELNLQLDSNSEDTDVAELRQFYGLTLPPPVAWAPFTGAVPVREIFLEDGRKIPDIIVKPAPRPPTSPIGPMIPGSPNRYRNVGSSDYAVGAIYTAEDGKRYRYGADGMFFRFWERVEE